MNFSELFIRRPVLTIVTSILVLLLGIQGFFSMTVREYPEVEESVITVTTIYAGASASLMQGFITTPIAKAVLGADNVDYVTSSSTLGSSTVSVNMVLNADPDQALVDVLAKVQQVRGQLPDDADDPVVVKGTGQNFALMYIAVRSTTMNPQQVTEFLTQVIQPRFTTVEGVGDAQILGGREFAMRVWLDPIQLAARNVTASDVLTAIRASNFLSAPGKTENDVRRLRHPDRHHAADPARLSGRSPCARMATTSFGFPTWRRSNTAPRTTTCAFPSTGRKGRSSASSPRPTPMPSTPPPRCAPSCRRSSASCRRA